MDADVQHRQSWVNPSPSGASQCSGYRVNISAYEGSSNLRKGRPIMTLNNSVIGSWSKEAVTMGEQTPAKQLAAFLAKYEPDVATLAKGALARLRKRLP